MDQLYLLGLYDLEWCLLGLRHLELGDELGCVLGLELVLLLIGVVGIREIRGEGEAGLLLGDDRVVLAVLLDVYGDVVHREGSVAPIDGFLIIVFLHLLQQLVEQIRGDLLAH